MSPDKDVVQSNAPTRRIVALGAGKGGVGLSMITTNLGVFLAQIGKKVTLIDANLPQAGLHSWLGMVSQERNISDILAGRIDQIDEALVDTKITGLSLLAGSPRTVEERGDESDRTRLFERISALETDFVLVDLPAGLQETALDLFGEADVSIVVTNADPDAVEATYRFLTAAFLRKLTKRLNDNEFEPLEELGAFGGQYVSIRDIISCLAQTNPEAEQIALRLAAEFHPLIIVNKIRMKIDENLGEAMVSAAGRWIGIVARLLGTVQWDDNVWLSLRRGIPILIDFPQSRACRGLERIVRSLLNQGFSEVSTPIPIPPSPEDQNLYELLEIYPGASEEEVRRAMKRIREYFAADGIALRGACSTEECEKYHLLVEEAHSVLIDKSRRREYDRTTFPDGFPSPSRRFSDDLSPASERVQRPHDSLPRVEIAEDQVVDGSFLGEIRRQRGVELIDISNRAKVSVAYLKAIEEERFDDLPAAVYVRGFVMEYARYLKIDPNRAAKDFMKKYEAQHVKKRTK